MSEIKTNLLTGGATPTQNQVAFPLLQKDPPKAENLLNPTVPTNYSVAGPNLGDFKMIRVSPSGRITIFSGWS